MSLNINKLPPIFPIEDVYNMIKNTKNIRDYALIKTIALSGLRVSEALNLKYEDINFKDKSLKVVGGKGDKDRFVVIHNELFHCLVLYTDLYDIEKGQRLFPITRARVFQIVKDLDKRFHPHTLRHCYATHLLDKGVPIEIISQQLGHKDIDTTMIYAHISLKKRREGLGGVFE